MSAHVGTPADDLHSEARPPSVAAEAPQTPQPADDEAALLKALSESGGTANNGTLRNKLGWTQDRYFKVRDRLLDNGSAQKSRGGPGGMTALKVPDETITSHGDAAKEPSALTKSDEYATENALYSPILDQIANVWIRLRTHWLNLEMKGMMHLFVGILRLLEGRAREEHGHAQTYLWLRYKSLNFCESLLLMS